MMAMAESRAVRGSGKRKGQQGSVSWMSDRLDALALMLTDEAEHGGADAADIVAEVEQAGSEGGEGDGEVEPREDWMRWVRGRASAGSADRGAGSGIVSTGP